MHRHYIHIGIAGLSIHDADELKKLYNTSLLTILSCNGTLLPILISIACWCMNTFLKQRGFNVFSKTKNALIYASLKMRTIRTKL